jgi:hypothetical protein
MKIIAFSRKHLSNRSRRARGWQIISLKIVSLEKKIHDPIFDGKVQVDIPLNDENNEITMLIPNPIAGGRIIEGTIDEESAFDQLNKNKNPFFDHIKGNEIRRFPTKPISRRTKEDNIEETPDEQIQPIFDEAFMFTINKALCKPKGDTKEAICYSRYGTSLIPILLQFESSKHRDMLISEKVTTLARKRYLKKGQSGVEFNTITDNVTKPNALQIPKDELAYMEDLNKGLIVCIKGLLFKKFTDYFSWNKFNFNVESFGYKSETIAETTLKLIEADVRRIEERLSGFESASKIVLTDDAVKIKMNILATSITDSILAHLGITGKGYEFFDDSINDFFKFYIFKFYLRQVFNKISSDYRKGVFMLALKFKNSIQIGSKICLKLKEFVSLDEDQPNKLTIEKMIFLRELFINEEKLFFKIMSQIELENWRRRLA